MNGFRSDAMHALSPITSVAGLHPSAWLSEPAFADWGGISDAPLSVQTTAPDEDRYRFADTLPSTPTTELFRHWRSEKMRSHIPYAARLAYARGELIDAALLLECYEGPKLQEARTIARDIESDWRRHLALFPLPENPMERRQEMTRQALAYPNVHWNDPLRSWQRVVRNLTDDELQSVFLATRAADFLRVNKEGYTDENVSVMDFPTRGLWRCETVTIWALHLLGLAHAYWNFFSVPGHVAMAIRTRSGDFLAFNNGWAFHSWREFRFAPAQLRADGFGPGNHVLLPPYAALAGKFSNFYGSRFETNPAALALQFAHAQRAALSLHPDFAEAHYGLANAYRQTGRLADSIRHYASAIRLDPDNSDARTLFDKTIWRLRREKSSF